MCRRVYPMSLKYLFFSSIILTALLIYCFGIGWDVYTVDFAFAKDSNTFGVSGQSWQNDGSRGSISSLSVLYKNKTTSAATKIHRTNNSAIGLVNKHSSRDKYARIRHGGINNQNIHGRSLKTTLKPYGTITSSISSKKPEKRPGAYTYVAMKSEKGGLNSSVYGEVGCPDNPWRKHLNEILRHWIQISKQNNIEYVLACGSLLGAMRDGDVIPYDSDIDVLVDQNYFSILKRLSAKRNFSSSDGKIRLVIQPEFTLNIPVEVRKRFNCQGKETPKMVDQCSFQEPMARLIKGNHHIDVYHFYDRVDVVEDPCEDRLKQYHKKDFYPFRRCSFMGLQASCPNNSREVLRIYFNSDDLEPIYKCKNGTWVDKDGLKVEL